MHCFLYKNIKKPAEVIAMRLLSISIILFSLFLWNYCYSQGNIYTWKDKNGVLNITDTPPPSGAEILDVSPSHTQEARESRRKLQEVQEEIHQERLEKRQQQQAIQERKEKAAALDKADELREKAEEMREGVEGGIRKRRRYEIRAERLEQQADRLIENPELIDQMGEKEKDDGTGSGY